MIKLFIFLLMAINFSFSFSEMSGRYDDQNANMLKVNDSLEPASIKQIETGLLIDTFQGDNKNYFRGLSDNSLGEINFAIIPTGVSIGRLWKECNKFEDLVHVRDSKNRSFNLRMNFNSENALNSIYENLDFKKSRAVYSVEPGARFLSDSSGNSKKSLDELIVLLENLDLSDLQEGVNFPRSHSLVCDLLDGKVKIEFHQSFTVKSPYYEFIEIFSLRDIQNIFSNLDKAESEIREKYKENLYHQYGALTLEASKILKSDSNKIKSVFLVTDSFLNWKEEGRTFEDYRIMMGKIYQPTHSVNVRYELENVK